MLIRTLNGDIYSIIDFISITKIDGEIDGILYYGVELLDSNNMSYILYKSNSEENCDKVIGKIWDRIKFGDNIIDVKTIRWLTLHHRFSRAKCQLRKDSVCWRSLNMR